MTDTTITPQHTEPATTDQAPPPPPETPSKEAKEKEVEHVPGGWPVVPLAVVGTNTTASLFAGAALLGGPVGLAAAATGAAALGAAAALRNRRTPARKSKTGGRGKGGAISRLGSTGTTGARPRRVPLQKTASPTGARPTKANRSSTSTGRRLAGVRSPSARSTGRTGAKAGRGLTDLTGGGGPGKGLGSRAGRARAVRQSARTNSPSSRAGRREQTTAARRGLADARRTQSANSRSAGLASKGPAGRLTSRAAGRLGAAKNVATRRMRATNDRRTGRKVDAERDALRKAPVRKAARQALRRSAMRHHRRRLLAAVLGAVVGVLGLISTPIGRRMGWPSLMHPGRRLYARLVARSAAERALRDERIGEDLGQEEAAIDKAATEDCSNDIGGAVDRPAGQVPAPAGPTTTTDGGSVSGFQFQEYAAEMESAANSYEPDDAMEILAMVEGLPEALTSVANVMRVLAERADSEFPLEKTVADGFNDIFGALQAAVAVAEDMGPAFRTAHEQDIARHEDPRNGPEAEKGWNV